MMCLELEAVRGVPDVHGGLVSAHRDVPHAVRSLRTDSQHRRHRQSPAQEDPQHEGKVPASLMAYGLPAVRLARLPRSTGARSTKLIRECRQFISNCTTTPSARTLALTRR